MAKEKATAAKKPRKKKAINPKTAFAVALGERLKAARGDRSLQDVADMTNGFIQARMLRNYEGGTEPRFATLLVLAAALGYKPFELIPSSIYEASAEKDAAKLVSLVG